MTMHSKHPNKRYAKPLALATAVASVLLSMGAQAQNLAELYDSARAFDATYQSAKLQYDANLARAEQARAGILPTAGIVSCIFVWLLGVSRSWYRFFARFFRRGQR